ncbi:flagellar basal body P-ring formation chaperone FlgA [Roseateles koreensis]|uniref:Flagellar basal body P-ring formation chaperone FlgA n=1 Tax=Roseateles koreensis TaxID=2987526 RepID=A0ABT5KR89_9BURK|nr:flagellar basal body P-ring formation chaperone FlgA [Roseateles koreensis]MDC8784297.1 flagellar basal body P-ring formation chaperone FlgA [Roseateles koreensis]
MFQIRPQSTAHVGLTVAQRVLELCAGLVMAFAVIWMAVQQAEAQTQMQMQAPTQDVGAAAGLSLDLMNQVQQMATSGAHAGMPGDAKSQARIEVEVGKLDPRLRLAPCNQIQPYLPAGLQMWGRTRIGLRCLAGASRWNVSVPVRVKVYAKAIVAIDPLAAGTPLTQAQLALAEIDIAAEPGAVFNDPAALEGRTLLKPLAAGEAVRNSALKQRQVFAAGDRVTVMATGAGYAVAGEGQALSAGVEGQNVKIQFENGRVVTGRAIAERRVEVLM